ncbi:MAG: phosphodiester glycosidase family protein [Armatimonadetes bacterium]|nr:phosphodiester glycosidase family protein [Armatimonadota bacterium]
MRIAANLCFAFIVAAASPAQIWEKPLAPGVVYHMEWDAKTPRIIHAVRISPKAPGLTLKSELAKGVMFPTDSSSGCDTLSNIAKRTKALVAINGDFFPFTGDPLGVMVHDGVLYSTPLLSRSAVAWSGPDFTFATPTWSGFVEGLGNTALTLDGVDEAPPADRMVLITHVAGTVPLSKPNTVVTLKSGDVAPSGQVSATVVSSASDAATASAKEGEVILVATGTRAASLAGAKADAAVKISTKLEGVDWSHANQAVGGGPTLLRDGKVVNDWEAQKFKDAFANKRHPRTAIGRTADGQVWEVVVEGRTTFSAGATLGELSDIMKGLGCVDAINLDGGGSSGLNLMGLTISRPSENGVERPVANAVVLSSPTGAASTESFTLKVASDVPFGSNAYATIVNAKGETIPNGQVFWAAGGSAWIDQGGLVHGVAAGPATVYALVRGQILRARVTIAVAPKKAA